MSNVTELKRSPTTLAESLRKLADSVEAGEVSGESAVVLLVSVDDSRPPIFATVGAPVSRFRLVGVVTAWLHQYLTTVDA